MIRLHFSTENSLTSHIICAYTWSKFSHVEFALPDGQFLGATNNGGVKIRPHNYSGKLIREVYGTVNCDQKTSDSVLAFAMEQLNKPYDMLGIFGLTIHEDIYSKDKWFCSDLVAAAFLAANYPLLNLTKVNRVNPGMLLASTQIVFDGDTFNASP